LFLFCFLLFENILGDWEGRPFWQVGNKDTIIGKIIMQTNWLQSFVDVLIHICWLVNNVRIDSYDFTV
jgi:hypothetical protein